MDEKPLKTVLNHLFTHLTKPEEQKRAALVDVWPQIAGERFAEHTKPRFAAGGRVTVWVDNSTLAFELSQRYRALILKRLQNQFGENEIKDVRFFVGEIR